MDPGIVNQSVCRESDWMDWDTYMVMATAKLGGNEQCDCSRVDDMKLNIEKRFYYNPLSNIRVSYLSKIGDWPIRGRDMDPPTNFTIETYRALKKIKATWTYWPSELVAMMANGTLRTGSIQLPVNFTVLYNQGVWRYTHNKEDIAAMTSAMGNRTIGLWWKTTSGFSRSSQLTLDSHISTQRDVAAYARRTGWGVLDAAAITANLTGILVPNATCPHCPIDYQGTSRQDGTKYWDAVHFQPWVYNYLNAMFMYGLCSADKFSHACHLPSLFAIREKWYKRIMDRSIVTMNDEFSCDTRNITNDDLILWKLYTTTTNMSVPRATAAVCNAMPPSIDTCWMSCKD